MKSLQPRRSRRLAICLLVLGLAAGGSTACTSGSAGSRAASSNELRIGTTTGFTTFDPSADPFDYHVVVRPLFNMGLTHQIADGSFKPALATSWHYVGSGNTVFEFTLRKGVTFSDGEKFDAAAVKGWFEYFQNGKGAYVSVMGTIKAIDVVDQYIVRVHLAAPNPIMPKVISDSGVWGDVMCPAFTKNPKAFTTKSCGVGPYVVDPNASVAGSTYTLIRNKNFYDPSQAHWSKVVLKVIPTANAMLQALQAGQLDAAFGDSSTAGAAKRAGFNVTAAPIGWVTINLSDKGGKQVKALSDVRVRQALNYAIDRGKITKALQGSYAQPTSEMTSTDGVAPAYTNYYGYDPKKASQLLAQAGYPKGFSFTVVAANFNGTQGVPVLEAVGQYLSAVGVDMKTLNATTSGDWQTKVLSGKYPAFQISYGNQSMYTTYPQLLAPGSFGNNGAGYAPIDYAYKAALTAANPGPYWQRIAAASVTQAYQLPVFTFDGIWYSAKNIKGLAFTGAGFVPWASDWTTA